MIGGVSLGNYDYEQIWNYTQEVLAMMDSAIYDIAVSRHTGNVYVVPFAMKTLLVMKNGNVTENVDIEAVQCVAVDNTVPQVYVGSENGLYIYNEVSGSVTKVAQVQDFVYKLFVPKHRQEVYVMPLGNGVYRYRHNFTEESHVIIDDVNRLVVDDDNNYFYTRHENNGRVTKVQLDGQSDTITFNDGPFDRLAVDNVGRVFGAYYNNNKRTVHLLKTDGNTQVVARLNFRPTCMSFDGDNNAVFGSKNKKIFKLNFN